MKDTSKAIEALQNKHNWDDVADALSDLLEFMTEYAPSSRDSIAHIAFTITALPGTVLVDDGMDDWGNSLDRY